MLTENQRNELSKKVYKVMKSKQIFKIEMLIRFPPSDVAKVWIEAEKRLFSQLRQSILQ